MKKIIAFGASNSSTSINKQLATYAGSIMENVDLQVLDLNNFEMPILSVDLEKKSGVPAKAQDFINLLQGADGIICSMTEHNKTYSAAFKNIMDWCTRIDGKFFNNRPVLLLSTSPGGYGGKNSLDVALSFFPKIGANIITSFSLPSFNDNFADGEIKNLELDSELKSKVREFENHVL